mgnify:CR=1 FL=1
MAQYLFNPPEVQSLPIQGKQERFPINRLFFVGRNYHAHAVEMGRPVDKSVERAFYFTKSRDTLVDSGATVAYPPETQNYHFEMELVIAIGKPGFRVAEDQAHELIYGYATGLDMTRRDLQSDMKKTGKPWCIGKAFDHASPIGPITPAAQAGDITQAAIWLQVNGADRQRSNVAKLIWNVAETIEHLSAAWELQPGDLIYTGTPEGVAAVVAGDVLLGQVAGLSGLQVAVK